jgi:NitT/TauT family transport system permease protein
MLIHTGYSLKRLFGGIALAIGIGAPIGILIGYFKRIDTVLSPLVYILGPLPKIAFLPLIMLFLGLGDSSKIFIVFIVNFMNFI